MDDVTKPTFLPDPKVAERYGVHQLTLRRWDENPDLGFPPVIVINKRRYREVAALEEWDRRNSRDAAQLRAGLTPRPKMAPFGKHAPKPSKSISSEEPPEAA